MIRPCIVALALAGCASSAQPASGPSQPAAAFEPAPTPRTVYLRQNRPVRPPEAPVPAKMPLGTGAVPVSNGPVRGSATVGLREAF